ncbi:unnamed protein product [Ixodes persulcatus]
MVDDNFTVVAGGSTARNRLKIRELKRSDFLTVLTCQAANNNVTVAVSRSITLDMNLIPLDVAIQPPKRALSADKEVELVCSSSGSRPPALLTWWKSGEQLVSSREHQVQEGISTSSSVLRFTPKVEDNGLVLSCRAENQFIPGSAIEEGWKLDVFYKPRVELQLGQNLKEHDIREGRDVYLECLVDASPPATEVTWFFEDHEVTTNMTTGVIISNQSLVLQKVRRTRRGRYTCSAVNREGHGVSNIFLLRIKFAPVCKPGQKRLYGVSRLESVSVRCELEADPADVTFHWRFNSSSSGKRLTLASYNNALTHSTAVYSPNGEDDFGFLLCWGSNEVGKQLRPCNFSVVPAGPPDPVTNCNQINGTEDSVSFECSEGSWDGGVSPVSFMAELRDFDSGRRLVANGSSHGLPSFTFLGLPGGSTFSVQVYSINSKGHKEPTNFIVATLRPAEKLTGTDHGNESNDEKLHTLLRKDGEEFGDMEEKGPDIIPATPLSKTRIKSYDGELDESNNYTKEVLTSFYNLPVSANDSLIEGSLSTCTYDGSKESPASDVVHTELEFTRPAPCLPAFPASTLPRSRCPGLEGTPSTEYSRIDFQRRSALRPLPPGHQIPSNSQDDRDDDDDDNTARPEACDTPLVPGNRMESTV